MTGWRTTKEILDLRDTVVGLLNEAPEDVRRHAYYWISFEMAVGHELQEKQSWSTLSEEDIKWLQQHPKRYEQHVAVKQRVIARLKKDLEESEQEMERLLHPKG